ncbi:hypothetical protein [Alicyclobacillus tolerans]|uniref:Uncharacterized protein n=1 Tax=Alicyclobacillus tolerans TaxID=90970 RepID=A0A1M6QND5_9BACL|nr:hypothetical protein [Alicyclobacillus montanus]SHK21809.1 hypothetical protein SAMN05443507_11061 [Alicyclobacillus montanus]
MKYSSEDEKLTDDVDVDVQEYLLSLVAPVHLHEQVMQKIWDIRRQKQIQRLAIIYILFISVGSVCCLALLLSPFGLICRVLLTLVYDIFHGLSHLPIPLSYGWLGVFAFLCAVCLLGSVYGLKKLLRGLQSEVLL